MSELTRISDILPDVLCWLDFDRDEEFAMKLVLPMPPNRANQRKHWRVALKEKKAYWAALDALRLARRLPPIPEAPPRFVALKTKMYVFSIMDHDNAVARLKYALDWLKAWGYIADDSPKHLRLEMPEQAVDRKNQRIEIEIREAA